MLDVVFAQFDGAIRSLKADVQKRRRMSQLDPVADAIDYCAGEFASVLERVKKDTEMLSPADFAALHRTTSQSVTAWCRKGQLAGVVPNGRSYLIPRAAVPPRRRTKRPPRRAAKR